MNRRTSRGGKLEKAFKGLSVVVATFVALPTQLLFLTPVPAYAHGHGHDDGDDGKITICHATGNDASTTFIEKNPDKSANVGGHAGEEHHDGRDIIPPFDYEGGSFPGQNWDEDGQAIYNNDCEVPEEGFYGNNLLCIL